MTWRRACWLFFTPIVLAMLLLVAIEILLRYVDPMFVPLEW